MRGASNHYVKETSYALYLATALSKPFTSSLRDGGHVFTTFSSVEVAMLSTAIANSWRRVIPLTACLCAVLFTVGCADDTVEYDGPYGEDANNPPEESQYEKWVTYKPEGGECADGTPYKYFVKERPESDNVLVLYEGGGACWNYETCSAAEGSLGALGVNCVLANKDKADEDKEDCLADNYADTYYALPDTIGDATFAMIENLIPDWVGITNRRVAIDTVLPYASAGFDKETGEKVSPMHDWNLVFVPYCTADLYAGAKTITYEQDPDDVEDGEEPDSYTFKHVGLTNVEIVAEELNELFPNVPQFAMNGCSAGGVGVMATYPMFRNAMKGIENGYVFSDAGPLFPTGGELEYPAHSKPLHDTVLEAWNIGAMFDVLLDNYGEAAEEIGITELPDDVSDLYKFMSAAFPNDRFNISHTQTDFNYSLYSYTSFYGHDTRANNSADAIAIYQYWHDDNLNLVDRLDELDNFSYYMPYWRRTNDSHCISLLGVEDVDGEGGDEVLGLMGLLNDPVGSYYAGTEIFEGTEEEPEVFTYRDAGVNLLDNEADPMRKIGLDSEFMGLRKYCTPPFLKDADPELSPDGIGDGKGHVIPDSLAKCECSFWEYDKVDETDPARAEALCGCLHENRKDDSVLLIDCECRVDETAAFLEELEAQEADLTEEQREELDDRIASCKIDG